MRRKQLANRRPHITQKAQIASVRTLYISVDSTSPSELFLRVKEKDISSEVVALYDVVAKLASLALQYEVPLVKIGQTLIGSRFEPSGPVAGHEHIKFCGSPVDLIGRHILIEHCGHAELAHAKKETV